ncbi:MAG: 6,7-dimethyl-8-ribityllumazine synthase [Candidatus Omnitrophica bacterium]|nr:6,7-dimethyl-8-ribityllumazine synthase [Candidatus Omnitrophota bacterium]
MREVRGSFRGEGRKIAILASSFNETVSNQLVEGCIDTLKRCGVEDKNISLFWVPGAYELPVVSRRLCNSKKYDALICLGAIIRGDTPHFEYIASSVFRALGSISQEAGIPVVLGVITAETQEQALERAGLKQGNRGRESALSALELIDLLSQIK